jgi:hypothetical protein
MENEGKFRDYDAERNVQIKQGVLDGMTTLDGMDEDLKKEIMEAEPLKPEPIQKIEVYKVTYGEREKIEEEAVEGRGAEAVADAVLRASQGLRTKEGLARFLLNSGT